MKIGIAYYGHTVDLDVGAIADLLDLGATDEEIKDAISEDVHEQLQRDPAAYRTQGLEAAVSKVKELLKQREEETA